MESSEQSSSSLDNHISEFTAPPNLSNFIENLPLDQIETALTSVAELNTKIVEAFREQIASDPKQAEGLKGLYKMIDEEIGASTEQKIAWQQGAVRDKLRLIPDVVQTALALKIMRFVTNRAMTQTKKEAVGKVAQNVFGTTTNKSEIINLLDKVNQLFP